MKYRHLVTAWLLFAGILVTGFAIVIKCNPPAPPLPPTFYCSNAARLCYTADKPSGYDLIGGYFSVSTAYCSDGYTYIRGGAYEPFRHCYPSMQECDEWVDQRHMSDSIDPVPGTKNACVQRVPDEGGTGPRADKDQGHL